MMRFSSEEVKHLSRAWIVISIAFAILNNGFALNIGFLVAIVIAAITVGMGFLLHELGHKYLAQRYGCIAEFRAFDNMLLITLLMSFFGFVIAAPGAVFIHGSVNNARNGRISAIGPLINIVLAALFFVLLVFLAAANAGALLSKVAYYGYSINAWLGLFNLIPIWQMDGAKVLRWNKPIYAAMVTAAVILMGLPIFAAAL
jgi:Zn-dependent protease